MPTQRSVTQQYICKRVRVENVIERRRYYQRKNIDIFYCNDMSRTRTMDPELTPGQRITTILGLLAVLFLLLYDAGAF